MAVLGPHRAPPNLVLRSPQPDAARVLSRQALRGLAPLGLPSLPANAAPPVDREDSSRDTVAVELDLRSYNPRGRPARFVVRTPRIARRRPAQHHPAPRSPPTAALGTASLFIDNAIYRSGQSCAGRFTCVGRRPWRSAPRWRSLPFRPVEAILSGLQV